MLSQLRRYLIAVGSPEAPGQRFLPNVARDVNRISDLFCGPSQEYERVLCETIPLGAPARLIQDTIGDWFTHDDRRFSDLVILYFAGHGGDAGRTGNYYLFTSDTDEKQPARTAINVGRFIQDLYEGDGERPQSLLLILDACFSGKGAAQTVAQGAPIRQQGGFRDGAGLWVIATADSFSHAEDGAFVDAIFAVFDDPAWTPVGGAEYLNPAEILVYGVNDWLQHNRHFQQAEWDVLGNRRRPVFLRNPRYTKKFDGTPLLDESHWDPKARGVEDTLSTGWFFTGRRKALHALVSWLNARVSDSQARVVTGKPGSGKSAVLARLVTSANPYKRAQMLAKGILDITDGTVPAENGIDAYVHARNLSATAIAASIAEQLSISGRAIDEVLASLAERTKAARIVIDALDEAQDPRETEFLLLRKLPNCPAIRLIVGTRKQGDSVPLAGGSEVIDLDDQQYFERADVVQYVLARLSTRDPATPYSNPSQHENARKIAELVADRAGFSFLFARIVARRLAAATTPIDTSVEGWMSRVSIPADLQEAFDLDLDRFSATERQVFTDLLVPLAWAQGKGLPQKALWAAVASSISGRSYSNADIENLKRVAGYYLVQDTENEQVVYRLFHESFAEYFRAKSREKKADGHFTAIFEKMAASSPNGKPNWSRVLDEYALHYLPGHAAAAGELDRLVKDIGFLLTFSPESLVPHLRSVKSGEALAVTRCYRAVIHHLRKEDSATKVSYLLLSATQYGAESVVGQLKTLSSALRSPWTVAWAAWMPRTVSEVVVHSDEPIRAFQYVEDQKRPSFVIGLDNCVVVYDAVTSSELIRSQPLGIQVEYLACVKDGQKIWIVVGGTKRDDKKSRASLFTLRYPSCEFYKERKDAHVYGWGALRGLCALQDVGTSMVATAGADLALRLWSIPDLSLVSESAKADFAAIPGIVAVRLASHSALVCGADDVNPDGNRSGKGASVFSVNLPDLNRIATVYGESGGFVKYLVPVTLDGLVFILAKFEHEGLRLLEMSSGRIVASTSAELNVFGYLQKTISSVVVLGEKWGRLQALELRSSRQGDGYEVELLPPNAGLEVSGNNWQGPLRLGWRSVIAGVDANQLRLLEMEDLLCANASPIWKEELTAAVGFSSRDKTYVITADRGGSIIVRDGATGKHLTTNHVEFSAFDYAKCIGFAMLKSKPIFIVGSLRGQISIFDLASGELLRTLKAGKRVEAITSCMVGGSSLLFAATNLNEEGRENDYIVTTWDLASGTEKRWGPGEFWEGSGPHLRLSGYQDKSLSCLAIGEDRGKPILYAAGPYSFVRAWKLETDKALAIGDYWMIPHRGNQWIYALAAGVLNGSAVIVAGNEEGILSVWDAASQNEIAQIHDAHRAAITALVFLNNNRGLITCGKDGILRVWSAGLEPVLQIDIDSTAFGLSMLGNDDNKVAVATRMGLLVLDLNF